MSTIMTKTIRMPITTVTKSSTLQKFRQHDNDVENTTTMLTMTTKISLTFTKMMTTITKISTTPQNLSKKITTIGTTIGTVSVTNSTVSVKNPFDNNVGDNHKYVHT